MSIGWTSAPSSGGFEKVRSKKSAKTHTQPPKHSSTPAGSPVEAGGRGSCLRNKLEKKDEQSQNTKEKKEEVREMVLKKCLPTY